MHPAQTAKATRCRARKGACVTTQWHFWSTVAVALGLWCPVKCKVRNVNGWKKCIEPDGWQAPTASELQQRRLYFLHVLGVTNRATAPHPVRENRGKEVNRIKESAGETFAPHACCLKWEVGSSAAASDASRMGKFLCTHVRAENESQVEDYFRNFLCADSGSVGWCVIRFYENEGSKSCSLWHCFKESIERFKNNR